MKIRNLVVLAVAAAAVVAAAMVVQRGDEPSGTAGALQGSVPSGAGGDPAPAVGVAGGPLPGLVLPAAFDDRSQRVLDQFDRLRSMPPGDAAIALGQQLEAGIRPDNQPAYVHALLSTADPAVERAAITALARAADGPTMVSLAENYGVTAPERRGRILQVLEQAQNPAAVEGLASIVAADTTEKRSPLVASSMYGIASTGSMQAVEYLLGQLGSPDNADFAMMALERVSSTQGVQMIQAAAQGSKDAAVVAPAYQPALQRIAEVSAAR